MKKLILLASVLLLCQGCLPGALGEYTKVQEAFMAEANVEASVSFHMHNGRYTSYSIAILSNEDNLSHDEIERLAREIIKREHTNVPQRFFIVYPVDINDEK